MPSGEPEADVLSGTTTSTPTSPPPKPLLHEATHVGDLSKRAAPQLLVRAVSCLRS